MILDVVFWGSLGLILGSFANVLILRGGRNLGGRSACPHCHHPLSWYELIPVFSWLMLMGRCLSCRAPISIQYPIVETLMAVGTLIVGLAPMPLSIRLVGVVIMLLLVCIAIYDLYHTIIPDRWSYSFAGLSFVAGALSQSPWLDNAFLFLIAGPLLAFPLAFMWHISRGTWMGLGDAKFALGIGWLLGIYPGYVALCLAFCIGAFIGVFVLLPFKKIADFMERKRITRFRFSPTAFTMHSEVPFGPFLILGLCIIWFGQLYAIDIPAYLSAALVLSR